MERLVPAGDPYRTTAHVHGEAGGRRRDGVMEQLERVLSVASGDELAAAASGAAGEWTAARTAALGAVLQKLLRGYTDIAISVTSGLITSITRFAVQAPSHLPLPLLHSAAANAACKPRLN